MRRTAHSLPAGKLTDPAYLVLEELPQLPKIDLAKTLAVCRGEGIRAIVCLQAREMLEAVYGDDAPGIFNNLRTTVLLNSPEAKTNKHYSDQLGSYTVEVEGSSRTKSPQAGSSRNPSRTGPGSSSSLVSLRNGARTPVTS